MSTRVNYDAVAPVYDRSSYRVKAFDPVLRVFLAERTFDHRLHIVDVACGTGAQLHANRRERPDLLYTGLDRSDGMLRIAQARDPLVLWLQGDAAVLPFGNESLDYVSNQWALHHIAQKLRFLAEVARVLRVGGRLAIRNLDPWSMQNAALYRYFPVALQRNLNDFLPIDSITSALVSVGFAQVQVERQQRADQVPLGAFAQDVRNRAGRSELLAMSDAEYGSGLAHVLEELERFGPDMLVNSEKCDVTITADKP